MEENLKAAKIYGLYATHKYVSYLICFHRPAFTAAPFQITAFTVQRYYSLGLYRAVDKAWNNFLTSDGSAPSDPGFAGPWVGTVQNARPQNRSSNEIIKKFLHTNKQFLNTGRGRPPLKIGFPRKSSVTPPLQAKSSKANLRRPFSESILQRHSQISIFEASLQRFVQNTSKTNLWHAFRERSSRKSLKY